MLMVRSGLSEEQMKTVKIKAGVIGAAGYTGGETIRLLLNHPAAQLTFAQSRSQAGKHLQDVFGDLAGDTDLKFSEAYDGSADVLFLCLDSEDPPPSHISKTQQDYVAHALAENPNVRWTLVFLHKPLWDYEESTGWKPIEELLKKRPHTVIAGHRHSYTKFERNDTSYIVLATTGGGTRLRGRAFGEFDQVAWITMTDKGPRIANLLLDGIWDENILTKKMGDTMRGALAGKAVTSAPLFKNGQFRGGLTFPGATAKLRISNDATIPMKFRVRFISTDQVHIKPAQTELVVKPNSSESISVQFAVTQAFNVTELAPLTAEWTITYEFPDVPPVEINGRYQW